MVVAGDTTWTEAGLLLAVLVALGFLVSWLATDVLRFPRTPYIAVLAAVTVAAVAATVWIAEVPLTDLLAHRWQAGVVGGLVAGAIVGAGIRQLPATLHRTGHDLHAAQAWEGVVYGVSEGALLSALPAFAAWQAADSAGWETPAIWAVALLASAVMIAIHHFGYWDFRGRQVVPAVGGCLVLTVAYLATGGLVAPVLGHVVMHLAGIAKGVELPPHEHRPTLAAPA